MVKIEKAYSFVITNVSTLGEKPQHRDKKITKPISPNISNPSQPMGLNFLWETVRTENIPALSVRMHWKYQTMATAESGAPMELVLVGATVLIVISS